MNQAPGPQMLVFFSYLIGSIPFGIILSKALAGIDPREHGSGNIGFTNVLRVAGRGPGSLTLLGDIGKGFLVVRLAQSLSLTEAWVWLIGLAAVIGHNYSVFLQFKGGKGVATGLGMIYALDNILGWLMLASWGVTVWIWRYSSLGAIVAFGLLPVFMVLTNPNPIPAMYSLVLFGLILHRHKENIRRLRANTEPKIGQS